MEFHEFLARNPIRIAACTAPSHSDEVPRARRQRPNDAALELARGLAAITEYGERSSPCQSVADDTLNIPGPHRF